MRIPNSSREYLWEFLRRAGQSAASGARVLDCGAGKAPYAPLFQHTQYETADFCQVDKRYGEIDHVCDLSAIPVPSDHYDLLLLTQVIEHLPEPAAVLRELHRILKPGQCLWLSGPLFYPEHEQPYDFYRYTQFGLTYLLRTAGFEIIEMEWLEGYAGTVSFQLRQAMQDLPVRPDAYGGGLAGVVTALSVRVSKPALGCLAGMLARADARKKWTATGHCKNWCVVARKPGPLSPPHAGTVRDPVGAPEDSSGHSG